MAHRRHAGPVTVGRLATTCAALVHRITAEVDGVPIWFESSDGPLCAAPEAFGSAFLIPALHQGVPLALAEPVDPVWLDNVGRLMQILKRWWRYPVRSPESPPAAAREVPVGLPTTSLFFSGGVDSFYSLMCTDAAPDRLVTVQGFDIALDDSARMAALEATLRAVAQARGLEAMVVRTNLRTHPMFRPISWERAHGGALAAIGHIVDPGRSTVIISSSIAKVREYERTWGSHWMTDPLFSSSQVQVREVGMERRRIDKISLIADEPLVRRHLRVCWENRSPAGNCSRCGKCLLTRVTLADLGVLDAFPVFDGTATLARDLDALPSQRGWLRSLTELATRPGLDPESRRAVRALLARSRHAHSLPVRARRAVLRTLIRWTAGARP